jgi:hypothetical protein
LISVCKSGGRGYVCGGLDFGLGGCPRDLGSDGTPVHTDTSKLNLPDCTAATEGATTTCIKGDPANCPTGCVKCAFKVQTTGGGTASGDGTASGGGTTSGGGSGTTSGGSTGSGTATIATRATTSAGASASASATTEICLPTTRASCKESGLGSVHLAYAANEQCPRMSGADGELSGMCHANTVAMLALSKRADCEAIEAQLGKVEDQSAFTGDNVKKMCTNACIWRSMSLINKISQTCDRSDLADKDGANSATMSAGLLRIFCMKNKNGQYCGTVMATATAFGRRRSGGTGPLAGGGSRPGGHAVDLVRKFVAHVETTFGHARYRKLRAAGSSRTAAIAAFRALQTQDPARPTSTSIPPSGTSAPARPTSTSAPASTAGPQVEVDCSAIEEIKPQFEQLRQQVGCCLGEVFRFAFSTEVMGGDQQAMSFVVEILKRCGLDLFSDTCVKPAETAAKLTASLKLRIKDFTEAKRDAYKISAQSDIAANLGIYVDRVEITKFEPTVTTQTRAVASGTDVAIEYTVLGDNSDSAGLETLKADIDAKGAAGFTMTNTDIEAGGDGSGSAAALTEDPEVKGIEKAADETPAPSSAGVRSVAAGAAAFAAAATVAAML